MMIDRIHVVRVAVGLDHTPRLLYGPVTWVKHRETGLECYPKSLRRLNRGSMNFSPLRDLSVHPLHQEREVL